MCGGQALIEGIMMRGPRKQAVVVRRPDGQLEIQEKELTFLKDRFPVLGWPLIRGVVNFCGSMYNGVTSLMFSAQFAPEEGEYFRSRKMAPQTVAGHFAAKEAFSKAMGTGLSGFDLREVWVVHDQRGRPEYRFGGRGAALAEGWRFSLSITHTADTAIAFAVAWKEETP